jgi:hypothetical protein
MDWLPDFTTDWWPEYTADDLADLYRQGVRVFVPAVGIGEGAYEAATTGNPTGAAKFFVPGIGVAEGVVGGGVDAWNMSTQPIRNAVSSTGELLLLAGAGALLLVVLLKKK